MRPPSSGPSRTLSTVTYATSTYRSTSQTSPLHPSRTRAPLTRGFGARGTQKHASAASRSSEKALQSLWAKRESSEWLSANETGPEMDVKAGPSAGRAGSGVRHTSLRREHVVVPHALPRRISKQQPDHEKKSWWVRPKPPAAEMNEAAITSRRRWPSQRPCSAVAPWTRRRHRPGRADLHEPIYRNLPIYRVERPGASGAIYRFGGSIYRVDDLPAIYQSTDLPQLIAIYPVDGGRW